MFPTSGPLFDSVTKDFGSLDNLITEMNAVALAIQGSGWAWLGWNAKGKRLEVTSTANQDPLLNAAVLVGIDIWE